MSSDSLAALDEPPTAEPSPRPITPDSFVTSGSALSAESPVPKLDTTQRRPRPRDVIECKECEGRGVVVELLQRQFLIEQLEYPCNGCNGRGFNKCRFPRGCDARWPNTFGARSWRWTREDWDKKPRLSWRWKHGQDAEAPPKMSGLNGTYPPANPRRRPSVQTHSTAAVQATLNRLEDIGIVPAGIEMPPGGSAGVLLVQPNPHLDHRAVPLRSLHSTKIRLETPNGSPGWHPTSRGIAPPTLASVLPLRGPRVGNMAPSPSISRSHTVCHGGVEHSSGLGGPRYSKRSDGAYFKPSSNQMARDPWFKKLGPRGVAGFHKTISHINVRNP